MLPSEVIDQQRVFDIVRSEFGYTDMPSSVIESVFKRNPKLFRKELYGQYKINGRIDLAVDEIETRWDDCEKKIQTFSNQLALYLETHIEVYRKCSVDQGMEKLIDSKLVNRANRKYNKIFEENQSKHRA